MTYHDLFQNLMLAQYDRIERDDRLLDIFPTERRDKGVELWEQWGSDTVRIVKITLPYTEKKLVLYELFRSQLEHLLRTNATAALNDFEVIATGSSVSPEL